MPKSTFYALPETKRNYIKDKIYDIFIENPYESISIRDLVAHVGISIGSFYKYFDSKEEMYLSLMLEIEQKIMEKEIEKYHSFFSFESYIDLKEILSDKEIKFDRTWLTAPEPLLYQFYFEGYAAKLYQSMREELSQLHKDHKLKDHISLDFAFHIIVTGMFNFIIYVRKNPVADDEQMMELKRIYFEEVIYGGIFRQVSIKI